MLLASLAALAIVVQDPVALRAAPRDSAQQQAVLSQGDTLEVRGVRMDYLQVYDHRRERAGYVRASQVREISTEPAAAPGLLSVLRFLRDSPGQETLGIAYAAAYLKAAPVETIDAEPFDALGTMADRLAQRASARHGAADDSKLAMQLDGLAEYGVKLHSFERGDRVQLCYDGEAFRRVLALAATPQQQARAALALTRYECVNPALPPVERRALDHWRMDVLDRVEVAGLSPLLKNRVLMRSAGIRATLAFEEGREGRSGAALATEATQALLAIDKSELADEDLSSYTEAAVRTGSSRWAAASTASAEGRLAVQTSAGAEPGETCVLLKDGLHAEAAPLLKRCTFGTVWVSSASANANGTALALAVQPLASWRELWLFHRRGEGWVVDVLPPASSDPDIGYAEFAGWIPGGKQLLAVREARIDGRWTRSFEVVSMDTMATEKRADSPNSLSLFYRWQSPAWKQQTLSLR